MDFSWVFALVTLTLMEVVLGIDNIIFIAIVAGRLPPEQQPRARLIGLGVALVLRILLLFVITLILQHLTATLVEVPWFSFHHKGGPEASPTLAVSWKSLILLAGGLFLIAKATHEIHSKLEGEERSDKMPTAHGFVGVIVQIILLDLVFSLDSVITAIGMVKPELLWVMITAVVIAVGVMIAFAGPVSDFVHRRPTLKMLALAFLILIGVVLVAEAFHTEIDKGYIYFAMAFSFVVEMLNLRLRKKTEAVKLREPELPPKSPGVVGPSAS